MTTSASHRHVVPVPAPGGSVRRASGARGGLRTAGSRRGAVVVGSGFGGMAAALRLRARGLHVTLVDRVPELGGRARTFRQGGYVFDAGPTVITAPYLLDELFELFGERLADHVELRPVWPWYRVQWPDGATFDYGGDPERMCEEIARFDRRDQDGYRRMIAEAERIYRIGYERLGDRPFHRLRTMAAAVPAMVRLRTQRSMYRFVASHLRNERLRQVFTFQPLLVGGHPFRTSCIYALIQPLEQRFGVHYAMGGTSAIVRALGDLMERQGIRTILGDGVEHLETRDRTVTGVRLESGHVESADLVVSNADPVRLYADLLPETGPHARTRRRATSMKLSMGLFVAYFGTKRTYPDLAHHTILLSDRYRKMLDEIFDGGAVPEDPSLYVHAPTRTDPAMAPPGHECFYALAPVPHLGHVDDWGQRAESYEELVLERIERCMAPQLREQCDVRFHVTPRYFETELASERGAGFGVQPTLGQSAWFRFHNRCPHYRNLYLVGAGTHPGAGIPGTLSTARTMENAMLEEGVLA